MMNPDLAKVPRYAIPIEFHREMSPVEESIIENLLSSETHELSAQVRVWSYFLLLNFNVQTCHSSEVICKTDIGYKVNIFVDEKPLDSFISHELNRFETPEEPARREVLQNITSFVDNTQHLPENESTRKDSVRDETYQDTVFPENASENLPDQAVSQASSKKSSQSAKKMENFVKIEKEESSGPQQPKTKVEYQPTSGQVSVVSSETSSSIIDLNTTQAEEFQNIIITKIKYTSKGKLSLFSINSSLYINFARKNYLTAICAYLEILFSATVVSYMKLSKWTELQGLIDGAMANKVQVIEMPSIGDDCVVRDTQFDDFDSGFRRAKCIGRVSNFISGQKSFVGGNQT